MALLAGKQGVKCDLCHLDLIGKFEYYSYSFSETQINQGRPPSLLYAERIEQNSIDTCENCHKNFSVSIVNSNANQKIRGTANRPRAFCEIAGVRILSGIAFIVDVAKISVCLKPNGKNTSSVDNKFLQFVISENSKSLFEPKPSINIAAQSWETKS